MNNYTIYKTRMNEEIKKFIADAKQGILESYEIEFLKEFYIIQSELYGLRKKYKKELLRLC